MTQFSKKPVILTIISTYLPGERAGGPVRTTANMVDWLGDDFDFKVVTSDRDAGDTTAYPDIIPQQWHRVGKAEVRYLAPEEQSLKRLRSLFKAIPYDVIYINAVFPTLSLKVLLMHRLGWLPRKPVIVAPRGQWRPEAMGLKSRKKRAFMQAAKRMGLYHNLSWHASNEDEKSDVEREVGPANIQQLRVIGNLSIAPTAALLSPSRRIKSVGKAKLIFMARMVHNKGLDIALSHLSTSLGDVCIDIYGSLEDAAYWEKCESIMAQLPKHIRANYCGIVPFDQVLKVLSQYHLFVLPTLSENFGQVILEALLAGCPVLTSDRTPWQDLTTAGAGWTIALDESQAWKAALQQMIDMDQTDFDAMSANALHYGAAYQRKSQHTDDLHEFFKQITFQ